ncbi:unnamed protein product [Rhizophagus irregularis]|uniref:Uncharacterized protein n=1 Tax=Rhizophagus irregularis TaxID=588596 RepID=A0A2I1H5E2_9GLOM|nr:hypothetical protein RhiirA4_447868 [Rhizophagus irregularis]CAB4441140.1 unnamed protein product [Rhizophagus irregularis]CAB4441199.1 unnamed protein product [Rhizophagus irregularis]
MKLNSPFTIACKNDSSLQICSCDFRVNIHDCPESHILIISNWLVFSYCGLLTITAATSLWYLIKKKDQAFFLPSRRDRGKIKPRPQHTYFTMCLAYCPFQMIHSILLLTDSYPNIMWAEIGHTLPIVLTTMVAILYPLSILYSISAFEVGTNLRPISMSSILSEVPITRNAIKTDLACIFMIIITFCLFVLAAALTGYYADINDLTNANKLFLIQNFVWAIWGFFYIIAMLWFWFRFINIVLENINDLTNQHQTQNSELQNKLEQLRKGTRNLSLPVYGQIITVIIYIPALILYGLYHRTNTIFNFKINLFYMSIWYFTFPLILHITQWLMIYNIITTPGNSGKNSTNKNHSRNNDETKVSVSTFNGNPKVKRNSSKMNSKLTGVENDIVEEEMYNTYTPKSDINNEDNEGNVNSISGILNKNDKISQPSGISGKRGSTSFSSHTIFSDTSTLITNGYNRPISPTFTMSNITTSCPTSPRFSSSMPSSPSSPSPISIPMVPIHRDSIASQRDSINSNMSNFSITSNFSNNISSNQRKEWLAKRPAITPNRHRPLYRDSYKNSL